MLTVRRIGIRSYYLTAALATLALALLFFALSDLVSMWQYQIARSGREVRESSTFIFPPAIFELARGLLMIFLTALLWGWLLDLTLRLARGVQFTMGSNNGTLALTRLSPARASLTVALVSMPLKAVSVLVEALEPGWFRFGDFLPYSVLVGHIEFIELAYDVLLGAITSFIFTWLAVLLFNRIAAQSGGLELQVSRSMPGTGTVTAVRVAHIQLTTALFAGCLYGLAVLLFRLVSDEVFLHILHMNLLEQAQPQGFSEKLASLPLKSWLEFALQYPRHFGLHRFLTVPAIWFLSWPLWALIYNFLARRNGGLELEVEGEWPEPAAAPEAGPSC